MAEGIRRLLDAEDYARFETAAEQIDEVRSEFEHCRRFASDVPDRLSRVGRDVSVLRSKYGLNDERALRAFHTGEVRLERTAA